MPIYYFSVRETTDRSAAVEAGSAKEARQLLQRWADLEGALAEGSGPIRLSDLFSVGFTFRSIKEPKGD